MVMEHPSPKCVGLELVRQYYTVLNKAPMFLHRFYSNDSTLTHGQEEGKIGCITGQSNIHKKIISLGFKDCHAKIQLVDAHMTLGNGVVVQVIGELSNNGSAMRPFMQTFVLAPQTPKKYYVHNDIFHYQDQTFGDHADEGVRSCSEDEMEPTPMASDETFTVSSTVNGTAHVEQPEPCNNIPTQTPPTVHTNSLSQQPTPPTPVAASVVAPVVTPVVVAVKATPSPPAAQLVPAPVATPVVAEPKSSNPPPKETVCPPTPEVKLEPPTNSPTPLEASTSRAPAPVSSEPKTYANLLKKSGAFTTSISAPSPVQAAEKPVQSTRTNSPTANGSQKQESARSAAMTNGSTGPPPPANSRPKVYQPDSEKRSTLPDTHQIFVGNLPHSVGEEQLRATFSAFGKVAEIRINTAKGKTLTKGNGHQVPNFGFVGFEDKETVKICLAQRPILLNGDRINVEEKKARTARMPEGGAPMTRGTGRGGPGMRGGAQRGRGGNFSRDSNRTPATGEATRGVFVQRR